VPAEALPPKLALPAYVATRVFVPALVGVSEQPPAVTVPMQFTEPSLTVTLPVGVPPLEVTLNVTFTAWPTAEGSGVSPVIVVIVLASLTVCATPADVLPAKFVFPAYVAVSVLAPAVVGVRLHPPAATVPTQFTVPSLTVTLPVGFPPAEVTV
jgi:hypothetical protein